MPLPPKLAHKRLASQQLQEPAGQQQQDPKAEAPAGTRSAAPAPAEDPTQQAAKITTSKILGTAQPRKPRIGTEFQAAIPDLEPR